MQRDASISRCMTCRYSSIIWHTTLMLFGITTNFDHSPLDSSLTHSYDEILQTISKQSFLMDCCIIKSFMKQYYAFLSSEAFLKIIKKSSNGNLLKLFPFFSPPCSFRMFTVNKICRRFLKCH